MRRQVLVVDDDATIRELLLLALAKAGFAVRVASSAGEAERLLGERKADLVISDIYMPGDTGLDLLARLTEGPHPVPVILMTARGSVETATVARRVGAFDYIAKPFDLSQLVARARTALEPAETRGDPVEDLPDSMIIGAHPSMVDLYNSIARVADLDVPVLLQGETGTGKELVARAIHRFGRRADGPFIAVNCGAIPDTLLESELFGHARGAFTDARHDRRGVFALAGGGTVLLDEIGDLPHGSQVKLLRFLEDHMIVPIGSERAEKADVRILAATNRRLASLAERGEFRQDLYFRLAAYEIRLPPLRERLSDLPLLVEALRNRLTDELDLRQKPAPATTETIAVLASHSWPGNVRELEQVIRRTLIDTGTLSSPLAVRAAIMQISGGGAAPAPPVETAASIKPDAVDMRPLDDVEREHIVAVLRITDGNKTRAAEILGIERKTLLRKLKRMDLASSTVDGDEDEELT